MLGPVNFAERLTDSVIVEESIQELSASTQESHGFTLVLPGGLDIVGRDLLCLCCWLEFGACLTRMLEGFFAHTARCRTASVNSARSRHNEATRWTIDDTASTIWSFRRGCALTQMAPKAAGMSTIASPTGNKLTLGYCSSPLTTSMLVGRVLSSGTRNALRQTSLAHDGVAGRLAVNEVCYNVDSSAPDIGPKYARTFNDCLQRTKHLRSVDEIPQQSVVGPNVVFKQVAGELDELPQRRLFEERYLVINYLGFIALHVGQGPR
ncbi:hypothetical protein KC350_g81 [Hortaea werneckii]|nr:hypothetical protein KC350_g81 [Hortaea werneckii]